MRRFLILCMAVAFFASPCSAGDSAEWRVREVQGREFKLPNEEYFTGVQAFCISEQTSERANRNCKNLIAVTESAWVGLDGKLDEIVNILKATQDRVSMREVQDIYDVLVVATTRERLLRPQYERLTAQQIETLVLGNVGRRPQ